MIGLDTNVLVRYIMQDDAKQSAQASEIVEALSEERPGFVSVVALIEVVWVLESVYNLKQGQVAQAIHTLIGVSVIKTEKVEAVGAAIRAYGQENADFADALIERLCAMAGCERTITFDKKAARKVGMVLIGSDD
jgi:predicted nucleic-acid-binding protein